jgi:hypothetical protein
VSQSVAASLLAAHYRCRYRTPSLLDVRATAAEVARAAELLGRTIAIDIAAFDPREVVILWRAWEATGRMEFRNKAGAMLQAYYDLPNWRYPHHQHMDQVELGMATLTNRLSEVWVGMGLDLQEEREELAGQIIARGLEPFYAQATDPERPGWVRTLMNWRGYICADMGRAAFRMRDVYPRWRDCTAEAIKGCLTIADAGSEDEGWEEGVGYWGMCFGQIATFAEELRTESGGEVDLFRHPYFRIAGDFGLYCSMPAYSAVYAFSDWRVPAPRPDLMAALARENNNPHYQWCAEQAHRSWPELQIAEAVPPEVPTTLPQSKHFRGIDVAILRSGWGEQATALGFKCGPRRVQTHQHLDANSFVLYAGSSPVVDEVECSGEDCEALYAALGLSGERVREDARWGSAATVAHNTLLFDACGQLVGRTEWGPCIPGARGKTDEWQHGERIPRTLGARIESFDQVPGLAHAIGEAAPAYPPPVHSFCRAVVLVGSDTVLVADRLEADTEIAVLSLLHTPGEVKQSSGNTLVIASGEKRVAVHFATVGTAAQTLSVQLLPWPLSSGKEWMVAAIQFAPQPPYAWLLHRFQIGEAEAAPTIVRESQEDRLVAVLEGTDRSVEIVLAGQPRVSTRPA